jgi:GntR family transcriptional regulator, arabinose operon transcriptional repressor
LVKKRKFSAEPHVPKYRQVLESLSEDVLAGIYGPGQKLPSEAALVRQFQTSRITIGRALRELVQRQLVERRAGSGTYVRQKRAIGGELLFGLLIPDLGNTEIFEPICHGIATAPEAAKHALLWGGVTPGYSSHEAQALQLCEQFIQRGVSGVFFAPIERSPKARQTNMEILSRLHKERIPVVLLDRSVLPYPGRSRHDLVAIDNHRAGYIATDHLLKLGVKRLVFLAYSGGALTIETRAAGFRAAILSHGFAFDARLVQRLDAIDEESVRPLLSKKKRPQAFVCANDRTAGHLMHAVQALGYSIPQDVRIVGIDDVEYASLLPAPLTTVHQPCREIGEAAMSAMLERIARPAMLARNILIECHLVVRQSCGAKPESDR